MIKSEQTKLINLLFRGEKLTSDDYVDEFTKHQLVATIVPTLEFEFKNLEQLARQLEDETNRGIIITSPRVVEALVRAERLLRNDTKLAQRFESDLVFVVGDKSGIKCQEKLNLNFNKQSAKAGNGLALAEFIKTFCKSPSVSLIYPKSSLSDSLIEARLASNGFDIRPLVVYETRPLDNIDKILLDCVKQSIPQGTRRLMLNMIFFSPSGVSGYLEAGCEKFLINQLNFDELEIKYSSIGKTTEAALLGNNLEVFCVAEQPNSSSLVKSIVSKVKEGSNIVNRL